MTTELKAETISVMRDIKEMMDLPIKDIGIGTCIYLLVRSNKVIKELSEKLKENNVEL